jgi:hypothetical protein
LDVACKQLPISPCLVEYPHASATHKVAATLAGIAVTLDPRRRIALY